MACRDRHACFASAPASAGSRNCATATFAPELGNIRVPTRFFHGVMDQIVPLALAESQAGLIKGASLVRFENSGHAIFWDEKDKLVDELDKFAAEKVARAAA